MTPTGPNGVRVTLQDHERRLGKLEDANVQVISERVSQLTHAVTDDRALAEKRFDALDEKFGSMTKILMGAAISVTGSAIVFALTIFAFFR